MSCFSQPHMSENHKLARERNMRRKRTAFLVKSGEGQVLEGMCLCGHSAREFNSKGKGPQNEHE